MPRTNAEVTRDYYQPPDPVVVLHCDAYGCEIYDRDIYYRLNGKNYCENCIEEVLQDEFDSLSLLDKLDLLDGSAETAEERKEW